MARASWDKVVLWNKHSTQYFINISLGTPPQPKMVRILPLAAVCGLVRGVLHWARATPVAAVSDFGFGFTQVTFDTGSSMFGVFCKAPKG